MAHETVRSQTSIVLCSGALQSDFNLLAVIPYFQDTGYRVIPRPIRFAGGIIDPHEAVLEIQQDIEVELHDGQDVCILLHSSAGLLGTEAINRVLYNPSNIDILENERKVQTIYLASFLDWRAVIKDLLEGKKLTLDDEGALSDDGKPLEDLFDNLSSEGASPRMEATTFQAASKIQLSSKRWQEVPMTQITCTEDKTIPPSIQEATASEHGMQVVSMKAGHCPFISRPGMFVEVVDRILMGRP